MRGYYNGHPMLDHCQELPSFSLAASSRNFWRGAKYGEWLLIMTDAESECRWGNLLQKKKGIIRIPINVFRPWQRSESMQTNFNLLPSKRLLVNNVITFQVLGKHSLMPTDFLKNHGIRVMFLYWFSQRSTYRRCPMAAGFNSQYEHHFKEGTPGKVLSGNSADG